MTDTTASTKPGTPESALTSRLYALLAEGRVDALVAAFSPSIVWTVPPGLPYGGISVGHSGVADIFTRMTVVWDQLRVLPDEVVGVADRVFATGHYTAVSRTTGRAMRARFTHHWCFADGAPISFETVADTGAMVAALS
ncbi:nuclear transport factor 2 family protein [Nocardia sp. NPDC004573]